MKMLILVLNQIKKQQFMTCYSSQQLVLLKMTINFSQKLSSERSLYYKRSFSLFGTHFDDRPKILIYRKISKTFKNIKENSRGSG